MSVMGQFVERRTPVAVAILGALIGLGISAVQLYQESYGTHSVVIASSPAEATLKVNGKDVGKTPITIELKRGTYTVEAGRPGYEPAQHAVFVSPKEPNLVNIQLVPAPTLQPPPAAQAASKSTLPQTDNSSLRDDVEKLKAAVMSNPEEALSLPLLREKIRVQEELSKATREELREVKEQSKWYLGSMIAIVVGLLAVIASLFVGKRNGHA